MHHHRFTSQLSQGPPTEAQLPAAGGFVQCPLALQQGWQGPSCPWQQLYQMAYAQARAVVKPSILERYQTNTPN